MARKGVGSTDKSLPTLGAGPWRKNQRWRQSVTSVSFEEKMGSDVKEPKQRGLFKRKKWKTPEESY